MITVSELKVACEKIEHEFGSDCHVVMQIYRADGSQIAGDYCIDGYRNAAGVLFLTNHKFKNGACT